MKKIILSLFLVLPVLASAQHKNKKKKNEPAALPPPRVRVGNIATYVTTREQILANPTLTTDSVGCRVSGFTISLSAPGHPFYGPLYAVGWEMTQVQKDVIKQWDYPDVTFYVQDIHLNCHETDATSPAFTLKFDH